MECALSWGLIWALAFPLTAAEATTGQPQGQDSALAAARQVLSKVPNLPAPSRPRAEDLVARLEASPAVQVPYRKMSPGRRAAFERVLTEWSITVSARPAAEGLSEAEKSRYFTEFQSDLKRLFLSPVFDAHNDKAVRQFTELKSVIGEEYARRCLAANPGLDRRLVEKALEIRLKASYRDPCEPAPDLTPLFKFPLAPGAFEKLKQELKADVQKDRAFARRLEAAQDRLGSADAEWTASSFDSLFKAASLPAAMTRIDQAFCEAVPSQVRESWERLQRANSPESQPDSVLAPGRCRYITFAAFRPVPRKVRETEQSTTQSNASPSQLLTGGPDGVALWDLKREARVLTFPVSARAGAFSPDGRLAAILGDDACYLVDVEEARVVTTYHDEQNLFGASACPMAFSHDGHSVALGLADGAVAVWDLKTNKIANEDRLTASGGSCSLSSEPVTFIAGDATGPRWVLGRQSGVIETMDCQSWKVERRHDWSDCHICKGSSRPAGYDALHNQVLLHTWNGWRLLSLRKGIASLWTKSHSPLISLSQETFHHTCISANGRGIACVPQRGQDVRICLRSEKGDLTLTSLPELATPEDPPLKSRFPFTCCTFDANGSYLFLGGADHPDHPADSVLIQMRDESHSFAIDKSFRQWKDEGKMIPGVESRRQKTEAFRLHESAMWGPGLILPVLDDKPCTFDWITREGVLHSLMYVNPWLAGKLRDGNYRMMATRSWEVMDPQRVYPLVGPAKFHRMNYACAFYEKDSRSPVAIVEVITDHLHATDASVLRAAKEAVK